VSCKENFDFVLSGPQFYMQGKFDVSGIAVAGKTIADGVVAPVVVATIVVAVLVAVAKRKHSSY